MKSKSVVSNALCNESDSQSSLGLGLSSPICNTEYSLTAILSSLAHSLSLESALKYTNIMNRRVHVNITRVKLYF